MSRKNPDELLTLTDAAEVLGLSRSRVHRFEAEGRLPAHARTAGGVRLFRRGDVEALARERKKNPPRAGPKPKGQR